jgi:Tfp pilus assembly protein PilF
MDGLLMRTINGKLFLFLLIGVAVFTGSVFGVHAFQYQRIAQALLWQARRAEEQGQPERAARYLRRYLEFNPKDEAEKATLARIWTSENFRSRSKARLSAVRLLDEVLRKEDNQELRRLLIKNALEFADASHLHLAREHLQKLLRWQDVESWIAEDRAFRTRGKPLPEYMARQDTARGQLEGFWAQILEAEKKTVEAIACYRLATRHAPQEHTNFVRLGYLLRRENETDPVRRKQNVEEADRTIDLLVKNNTASHESYLARWRYRRDFGLLAIREAGEARTRPIELAVAAEDVAQALKRKPEAIEVLLAAADLERLRGRTATDDPALSPEQRRTRLSEHRQRALEYLNRGEKLARPDKTPAGDYAMFELMWQKGNLLLDDLDLQRAQQIEDGKPLKDDPRLKENIAGVISQVRKAQMAAAADYMQGRLLVHERRWAEAALLFEQARAQFGSQRDLMCQANLYLGQCYEKLEEHTQMYDAFQRVLEHDPNSVPALLGMAMARWSQGQLDNALTQYQAVMRQKRVPARVWIDIARLEMQRQVQQPRPDWGQVEKILQGATDSLPENTLEVTLLRAEVMVRQGKSKEARTFLESAREKTPNEVELWTALVDLAIREKSLARAKSLLEQARRQFDDKVSLRLAQARYLSVAEGEKAPASIGRLAENRDRFGAEDQARLLTGLADTLYRADNVKEARKLWQAMTALPRQQTDLRLQLLLFDLAVKENDEEGMKQTLADIAAIEQSSGAYHRYGKALHLIWKSKRTTAGQERIDLLKQAREHLDRVLTLRPSWPPIFLARADVAELNGNPEQAIKDLESALKSGENSPTIIRRLVMLLTRHGRDQEAQFHLAKLQQTVLYGTDMGRLAVTVAIRRGETDKALDMLRQAVREDTKDPQDLVWMARVFAAANQPDEAEKRLRQALTLAPTEGTAWQALVEFLMSQKRRDEARESLKQIKEKVSADSQALTLAVCHDLVGQPQDALRYYDQALQARRNDPATVRAVASAHLSRARGKQAEPLLRELIGGSLTGTSPADRDWARRALAMVLASGTDYRRFTEALELVGLKLDETGRLLRDTTRNESTDDRRAKARVLASQNQGQFRKRAIEILEELASSRALTSDDAFVLAMLYEAEGQLRKSQDKLKALVEPRTRTPRYLAQYAAMLISQRPWPEALKEAEKVIGWLEEIERQLEVGPNTFASVEMRARLLEARAEGDMAVSLLKKHIARKGARPEEVILVLDSLRRQKKYEDALTLCEETWKAGKCQPEVVGAVSVSILRVMNPSDAQVAAVEGHLRAAIAKKPESTVMVLHLANLYDKRGQYDKAAESYREVLKREPNNVVALNNLAWLLAHRSEEAREALEFIDRAVNGMGRRADLLDTRGLVHLALKDTKKAVADLKDATNEGATPARLFHLARAHHEERDPKRAREALRQAKDKGLQVAELHPVEQDMARRLLDEYGLR